MRQYALIFSFLLLLITPLLTATATDSTPSTPPLPTKSDIQSALRLLAKQHELSKREKVSRQDLRETLSLLEEIAQVKQDEVQRRIVQLCRENGINIAFNQLDVHVFRGTRSEDRNNSHHSPCF